MLTKVLVAGLMLVGQVEDEDWEILKPRDKSFAVSMPAVATQVGDGPILGSGFAGMQHEMIRQTGGMIYIVTWYEAAGGKLNPGDRRWLDFARDRSAAWLATAPGRVVSEKAAKVGGEAGREFVIRVDQRNGPKVQMRGRATIHGGTMYRLLAIATADIADWSKQADRFLDSFTFDGGASGTAAKPGVPPGWRSVSTSKAKYTVALPGAPNGRRGGSETMEIGDVTTEALTADYPNVHIIIQELTVDAPNPTEAALLEVARTKVAETAGSFMDTKVVAEKPIELESARGTEFTLKVKQNNEMVDARGRAFVRGKSAYALLAVAPGKGKPLPKDVGPFLDSFRFVGAAPEASTAGAATPASTTPEPRADRSNLASWGRVVDPDNDVTFRPSGRSLTVQVPATAHVMGGDGDKFNAPRVLAPAPDDCRVSVTVDGAFNPGRESTAPRLTARQAGGLILWKDADNYLALQRRTVVGRDGKATRQIICDEHAAGRKPEQRTLPAPDGPVHLRLDRSGGKVVASFSPDGRAWKPVGTVELPWFKGPAEVGVVAVNTSTEPHTVTFRDLAVEAR